MNLKNPQSVANGMIRWILRGVVDDDNDNICNAQC